MTFLPVGGYPLSNAIRLNVSGIPSRINFNYFLDRKDVIAQIGKVKAKALKKAGYKVMQTARRSIKKMGMAKPVLKVMNTYKGMSLKQIAQLDAATEARQGVRRDAQGRFLHGSGAIRSVDGQITEADRRKVVERLREIQAKAPSPPGTPPHTHKGVLRRDIVFAWDPTSESVVIGSFMRGGAWLASLHEFGGREQMRGWAWIPRWPRSYRAGIIGYWRTDRSPRERNRWEPTNFMEMFDYPKRPYMRPAILACVKNKSVVNSFRVGGLGN